MKALLVTNFAPHYRAPFFERLAAAIDVEFIFTSTGSEPYWQAHLGTAPIRVDATTVTGRRLPAGLRLNTGLVRELATRDYDVMVKCISGRFDLAAAYSISKARGKPFVFWTTIWWQPVTVFGWLSQPALQAVYRGADAIVTDGPHISRFVAGHGVDSGKIFEAEFSIDNDWFMRPVEPDIVTALRESLGAEGRPLVLAVSRLVPEKGLDVLIAALGRLADLRPLLVVAGTGPLGAALEEQALRMGVGLRLLGGVPPVDMPSLYAAADVYVMPSITTPSVREPWGLGVNEAHCQRVPVVASDAVGAVAGGLVLHRETGLVVPERDTRALADAIREMLTSIPLSAGLAAAGHARVERTNFDAMVAGFMAAIDHAVSSHRARQGR